MTRHKRLRVVKAHYEITLEQAIENFLSNCKAKNLSEETVKWYSWHLSMYARSVTDKLWYEPTSITSHILLCLKQGIRPQTVDGRLRALRAFFNWLKKTDQLNFNPIQHIERPRVDYPLIRTFTPEQIETLLKQPDRITFAGLRDYTAMLVMLDTGIRLSELLGLQVKDCNLASCQLLVHGKGRKERIVPFGQRLRQALVTYIAALQPKDDDAWLFPSVYEEKMKRRSLEDRIATYGKMAGITGVRVSPHTFRHTFAKMFLLNGGDIFSLQRILGHSSLEVVKRYVNLLIEDIAAQHRKASPLDQMNLPFGRKRKK